MPVIPKENRPSFKRWKIDSFDPPRPKPPAPSRPEAKAPPSVATVEGIPLPTAESIERMQAEARREGYEEGLEEGRKKGYETGLQEARRKAQQIATLATSFEKALAEIDQTTADALLELSIAIARQVVQQQLESRPESILSVIRAALPSLPLHHGNINLVLHPEDAHLLRDQLGNQVTQAGWHLLEDSSIERGGCLIRAGTSEIDATLATRWHRVLDMLGKSTAPEHHES